MTKSRLADLVLFSKNRDRLLDGDVAAKFLAAVLAQPRVKRLLSNERFSVDGTLIEAWASMKSFTPKGVDESPENKMDNPPSGGGGSRNREADFHGEKRSNDTHASTSDPDARLEPLPRRITLAADKGYDAEDFVNELRSMRVRPHVAQNLSGRSSAIDRRTARHAGYRLSQRIRKRIEEGLGWIKTVAGQEKTKLRGCDRLGFAFAFAAIAYNMVRLPKLLAAA